MIKAFFVNMVQMISPPTLQEVIAQKMLVEAQVVMDSEHVIMTHQFQRHMANASISALEEWNRQHRFLNKD